MPLSQLPRDRPTPALHYRDRDTCHFCLYYLLVLPACTARLPVAPFAKNLFSALLKHMVNAMRPIAVCGYFSADVVYLRLR